MNSINNLSILVIILILILMSVEDIKHHEVSNYKFTCLGLIIILYEILDLCTSGYFYHIKIKIYGLLLAIFLCFIIKIFYKDGIGEGDIILFIIFGFYFGIFDFIIFFLISYYLALPVSLYLIFFKKKKLKEELAFIPFITLSFIITLLIRKFGII